MLLRTRPSILWFGGFALFVGSIVFSTVTLAGSAPPNAPVRANQGAAGTDSWPVTASQGAGTGSGGSWKVDGSGVTQPVSGSVGVTNLPSVQSVSGSVGISGSLPAGSNDIGTVHVAVPNVTATDGQCQVQDTGNECFSTDLGLSSGTLINTVSVQCTVAAGQHASARLSTGFVVPLSFQTAVGLGGPDEYFGIVTSLGAPVQAGNFLVVDEDYSAFGGNGARCIVDVTVTTP